MNLPFAPTRSIPIENGAGPTAPRRAWGLLFALGVLLFATALTVQVNAAPLLDPPTPTPTPLPCCGTLTVPSLDTGCRIDLGTGRANISIVADIVNQCSRAVTANVTFYLQLTAQNPPTGGWFCWDSVTLANQQFPAQMSTNLNDTYFLQEAIPTPPPYQYFYRVLMRVESPDLCQTLDIYSAPDFDCATNPDSSHINCSIPPLNTPTNTPTPTPTATPTPTNTPTPVCSVPTPFAYPWGCNVSPTATSVTVPRQVRSYYVLPTNTPLPLTTATATATPIGWKGIWYQLGQEEAMRALANHDTSQGIAVLNFGRPYVVRYGPDEWGTLLLLRNVLPFAPLDDIKKVASDFATGFYETAMQNTTPGEKPPRIIIALGTNNYWMPTDSLSPLDFYQHGRQWGLMINYLGTKYITWRPVIEFDGANDIEFSWSTPDRALLWAKGFEEVTRNSDTVLGRRHYYVYGSCDDCAQPPDGRPDDLQRSNYHPETPPPGVPTYTPIPWYLDQIVGAVWANKAALTLPQIYYEDPIATPAASRRDQPAQWKWLSSYSSTHDLCLDEYGITRGKAGKIIYSGVLANPPGGICCIAPDVAWQHFHQVLSGSSCTFVTPYFMPLLSPIYDSPR